MPKCTGSKAVHSVANLQGAFSPCASRNKVLPPRTSHHLYGHSPTLKIPAVSPICPHTISYGKHHPLLLHNFVPVPLPIPTLPCRLPLSTTYPLATGLHPIPPTSGIGKGSFLSELVKNTGCLVAASYALFAGADNDIGGVRVGGIASIWLLGLGFRGPLGGAFVCVGCRCCCCCCVGCGCGGECGVRRCCWMCVGCGGSCDFVS